MPRAWGRHLTCPRGRLLPGGRPGALAQIAAFFRRTEPHSPVAYLLERAVAWATCRWRTGSPEVVRDESTLSSIRERVGLAAVY